MNKPTVGAEVPQAALSFDQKGLSFHRMQMITVYGSLSFCKKKKKAEMDTFMLGLDPI